MTESLHASLQGGRPTAIERDIAIFVALGVAALAGLGLRLQWATHLNHDVAWILYSAERMLRGAVFGRDIVAANPPLIWFLSMPVAAASQAFGWPIDATFRIFAGALAAGALTYTLATLQPATARVRGAVVLLLAYFLFIGCHRDYGQREYLSLVLAWPYLVAAAARMEGRRPGAGSALAIGIAAGVGLALKPFFLAVPLLVEAALLQRRRSPRLLLRLEIVAMGATGLLYGLAVLVLTPAYLTAAVPLLGGVYWGFDRDIGVVFGNALFDLLGLAALLGLYVFGRRPALLTVTIAAALGYTFSYLVQFKGYSYHEFPMRVLIGLGFLVQLSDYLESRAPGGRRPRGPIVVCGAFAVLALAVNAVQTVGWYRMAARPDGVLAREIDDMVRLVDTYAADGAFLAVSTHPFPGFPTAIYAHATWGGRSCCQLLLPAAVKMEEFASAPDAAEPRRIEALARTQLFNDLVASTPRLLLVDANEKRLGIDTLPFDFVAFYLADPRIRAIWRNYRELPPVDGFRVFVRQDADAAHGPATPPRLSLASGFAIQPPR